MTRLFVSSHLLARVLTASLFLTLNIAASAAQAQNAAVTVSINAQANRHAISPQIYGLAYGAATALSDLKASLNRLGGNNATRYNWQANADNKGSDYYFESVADTSAVAGERGDTFFSAARSAGAQALLTVPLLDWVAKVGAGRNKLASFSVAKYGAQTGTDWQWYPDAGNGVWSSNGQNITGNDPSDANVASSVTYQQAWIQHLVSQWGTAATGGVPYYILDNEPSIWHQTHRDVHPTGATMDEIKNRIISYASMIKSIDASAQIVGPEEWGWSGYFYSGYDQQYGGAHGWSSLPDRSNHGGADYMPWLLDQLHQYEVANKKRLLDVFSLHYYPQGGEFSNDTSTTTQLRRNRSTRSLWDPNYVDETWINNTVQLIPRMKSWLNTYYPGLKTAITEYNWGAEGHINGATTLADILGIFGREGLDMATYWTYPDPSTPTYKAFKLYRNYDNAGARFGDISVAATAPTPDTLSAFAATRASDGALTVMVISKVLSGTTPVSLALSGFSPNGTAQAWQLTSANAITRLSDLTINGSLTTSVPAQSITLFVIPAAPAVTTITGLFNTGVDSGGNAAADASGDAHYNLINKPGGTSGTSFVTLQKWPIISGAWMLDSAASKWISPVADESSLVDAPGDYTYQTTFTIAGDPTRVSIAGKIAADNIVKAILLNGNTIASNLTGGFSTWTAFTLASGLQAGTNTVQFIVTNGGTSPNPSGFRCEMTGVVQPLTGVITGLYNTGLDNSGNAAADSAGDAHYTLVSAPSTGGSAVVTQQHFPVGGGAWIADTSTSKWISPYADESLYPDAPGNYTYQTTFTITGDASTVKISGGVAADNQVTAIILNGVTVATNVSSGFAAFSSFVLTTGLVSGTNTLRFVVHNDAYNNPNNTQNNPSGFRCEMTAGAR